MHISNRTLIEITSAAAAVALLADAYSTMRRLNTATGKYRDLLMYYADVMDREKVRIDKFDEIAVNAIADR